MTVRQAVLKLKTVLFSTVVRITLTQSNLGVVQAKIESRRLMYVLKI